MVLRDIYGTVSLITGASGWKTYYFLICVPVSGTMIDRDIEGRQVSQQPIQTLTVQWSLQRIRNVEGGKQCVSDNEPT